MCICAASPHLGQSTQQTEHLRLVRDVGEIEPLEKAREESALVHEALYGNQAVVGLEQDVVQRPQPYLLQRVAWSEVKQESTERYWQQSTDNTLTPVACLCRRGFFGSHEPVWKTH